LAIAQWGPAKLQLPLLPTRDSMRNYHGDIAVSQCLMMEIGDLQSIGGNTWFLNLKNDRYERQFNETDEDWTHHSWVEISQS
jgi:hypothetical protein